MKVLSLFSGAGGLDLGLIQAGNTVVWANDIDENAVETYKKNIGEHIVLGDIKNIDIKKLPKADAVVGGFPCQGFSQANRFRMLDDERNTLYKFFYEVIHEKQPKFFIAENVKGILSLGKGEAIKQIISDFEKAGYYTDMHLVNMADYGVPETRQRVIIIGQRHDLGEEKLFKFPSSSYHSKGKGDEKIYQASLNYNWKSKNGKNTLQTVLDYLRSDETQELNYHYLYQYPDKNEENNKCSNNGTVSDLWKAEIGRAHV